MVKSVSRHHLDYVSRHINQTRLVLEWLQVNLLSYDDIIGWDEDTEVFQWLAFNHFYETDYERLKKAGIPFLDSEFWTWVGITSYGSHYDLYVYPELLKALFDVDCDHYDLDSLRQKTSA